LKKLLTPLKSAKVQLTEGGRRGLALGDPATSLMSASGDFSSKLSDRRFFFKILHSDVGLCYGLPGLILDAGCAMVSLYDEIRHLFGTIMFIECTF
jgi:hypothetical protein